MLRGFRSLVRSFLGRLKVGFVSLGSSYLSWFDSHPDPDPLPGVRFLVGVVFCLFVGAQLMFEYR